MLAHVSGIYHPTKESSAVLESFLQLGSGDLPAPSRPIPWRPVPWRSVPWRPVPWRPVPPCATAQRKDVCVWCVRACVRACVRVYRCAPSHYDNTWRRREDSPFLRVSRLCDHSTDDRISEKLWVTDHLPFVPVCCQERSFGNRMKLRFTLTLHVFITRKKVWLGKKEKWISSRWLRHNVKLPFLCSC